MVVGITKNTFKINEWAWLLIEKKIEVEALSLAAEGFIVFGDSEELKRTAKESPVRVEIGFGKIRQLEDNEYVDTEAAYFYGVNGFRSLNKLDERKFLKVFSLVRSVFNATCDELASNYISKLTYELMDTEAINEILAGLAAE